MNRILALLATCGAVSFAMVGLAVFGVSAAERELAKRDFGNHTLHGSYEFHADGVVEINGVPTRGFWEAGRFDADGKGNITNGVEYSSVLSSSDENLIDTSFTFSGTYSVNSDGIATGTVQVKIAEGIVIEKKLWLVLHSVGKDGIANGFAGGHAHADLGNQVHGNTRVHEGWRINLSE